MQNTDTEYTPTIGLKIKHPEHGIGEISKINEDGTICCTFNGVLMGCFLKRGLLPARSFKINRAILFFASDCQINEMEIRNYFTQLAVDKFISDGYLTEVV